MNAFGKFLGAGMGALARSPSPQQPPPPNPSTSTSRPSVEEEKPAPVASSSSSPSPPARSQTLPSSQKNEAGSTTTATTTPPSSSASSSFSRHRGSVSSPTSPTSPGMISKGAFFRLSKSKERAQGASGGSISRTTRISSSMKSDDNSSVEPRSRSPSLPRTRGRSSPTSPPSMGSSSKAGPSRLAQKKPPLPSLAKAIYATAGQLKPSPITSQPASGSSSTWKNVSTKLNVKDELLMSLLASQAVVDSRDSEILAAEDVDELKREYNLCSSRVAAATRKVSVETKIRDAALSLYNMDPSNLEAMAGLNAANLKLETAQQELYRISERANTLSQRLLEHRAGVLSFSMRSLERKVAQAAGQAASTDTDSESSTELAGEMSPASTAATSLSMAPPRKFDGAHLYAGHADALVPLTSPRGMAGTREMEARLKQVNEAVELGKRRIVELEREVEMIGLEKAELELAKGLELQTATDTIHRLQAQAAKLESLKSQLQGLEEERRGWETDKRDLEDRLSAAEKTPAVDREREETIIRLRAEVLSRESENRRLLDEKKVWEREKESLRRSLTEYQAGATEEVIVAREALRAMCRQNKVSMPPGETSLVAFIQALEGHLSTFDAAKDQMIDSRETLLNQLEEARKEREEARRETRAVESKLKEAEFDRGTLSRRPSAPSVDSDHLVSLLKPIWAILPSVEIRASRLGVNSRTPATPRSPKVKGGSLDLGSSQQPLSLSDLDVKSLKALYDPKGPYQSPNVTGEFTAEEFAGRVQALVADDRALVERLLRFAGAHDLLKSNAERAQKLAQESSQGLETYQKQVKTLEERCQSLTAKQTSLLDEIDDLQTALERAEDEKRVLQEAAEERAKSETAKTPPRSSTEDTAKLKALEAELAGVKKELSEVNDELDRTRHAESSQRVALLDELNSLQQENGNLRNQLRRK